MEFFRKVSESENRAIDRKIDRYLEVRSLIQSVRDGSLDENSDFLSSEEIVRLLRSQYINNLQNGDSGEENYNLELNQLIVELSDFQKVD